MTRSNYMATCADEKCSYLDFGTTTPSHDSHAVTITNDFISEFEVHSLPEHEASTTTATHEYGNLTCNDPIVIGLILSNGISRQDKYKCHMPNCTSIKTFSRLADLKRHNASKHNRQGARFWCPVDGCQRSLKSGGRAFPRKDKMYDHLERVHADKVGATSE